MSHPQFSGGASGLLIELDTNTSNVWGGGNPSYPYLGWQVPLFISFHRDQPKRYAFRRAEAQLFFTTGTGTGTKIADARPVSVNRLVQKEQGKVTEYLNLEFPLDMRQICALEDYRQGGSLKLHIWMQLHIDECRPVQTGREVVWELESLSVARLQQGIEIAQTHWVNQVLLNVGYGKIHVVEFPAAPLESCQSLDHSFKALKQAEEKHRLGFYDDAVGKCRIALDPFFEYADKPEPENGSGKTVVRRVPILKKGFEATLGAATYVWLDQTLGVIKGVANRPHHSPNAHYSQFDSQMILGITTAVVAYVARSNSAENIK